MQGFQPPKLPTLEEMMKQAQEEFAQKSKDEQDAIENQYKQQGINSDSQMAMAFARDKNPGMFDALMKEKQAKMGEMDKTFAAEKAEVDSNSKWALPFMALAGFGGAQAGGAQGASQAMAPILNMMKQKRSDLSKEQQKKKDMLDKLYAEKKQDLKFQLADTKDEERYAKAQAKDELRYKDSVEKAAEKAAEDKRRFDEQQALRTQQMENQAKQFEQDKALRLKQLKTNSDWRRQQETWRREDKEFDRQLKRDLAKLKLKEKQLDKNTTGAKAVDRDYAKEYNEWTTTGRATYNKNMKRLQDSMNVLKESQAGWGMASGPITNMTPKFLKPDQLNALEQNVRGAAMGALKATLGAQFTEKEGERIMQVAYDPSLSEEENIKKVQLAIEELNDIAAANESKAKYFEDNGNTIVGWKSPQEEAKKQIDMVRVRRPDGTTGMLPRDKIEAARKAWGGLEVLE